ncbi:MAG: YsnF/AvaK domain-containing protein, partial [Actinomycetes bacterium]
NTGLFGTKSTFVPLAQATPSGGQVQVPYDKQLVKDAPRVDPDGPLSEAEERQVWRHYGLDYDRTTRRRPTGRDAAGRETSGPTTDDAMTRSEEELRVGTTQRERGRARLRKYVVTETRQVTVPVQREELRVERDPITDANRDAAVSGPEISEEEHEVTLREEEPVVEKRVVPRERVRLDTETVTDERQVAEEVRKEQIEVEGDQDRLNR